MLYQIKIEREVKGDRTEASVCGIRRRLDVGWSSSKAPRVSTTAEVTGRIWGAKKKDRALSLTMAERVCPLASPESAMQKKKQNTAARRLSALSRHRPRDVGISVRVPGIGRGEVL